MKRRAISEIDIGAMIRAEVDRRHWAYADFARAVGCSRSSLYNIFNSRDISLFRFLKICQVLDCNLLDSLQAPAAASLTLPIRDGAVDLSGLPAPLIAMLRDALAE